MRPLLVALLLALFVPATVGGASATGMATVQGDGSVWLSFDSGPEATPVSAVLTVEGVTDLYMGWLLVYDANGTLTWGLLLHFMAGTLEATLVGEEPVAAPPVVVRPLGNGTFETTLNVQPSEDEGTLVFIAAGGASWRADVHALEGDAPPAFGSGAVTFLTSRDFEGGMHAAAHPLLRGVRIDDDRSHGFETSAPAIVAFARFTSADSPDSMTSLTLATPGYQLAGDVYALDLAGPGALPVGAYSARVDDVDLGGGQVFLLVAEPSLL